MTVKTTKKFVQTELDFTRAREAKTAAIDEVEDHADAAWKYAAYSIVLMVAARGYNFTSDDVWRTGLPKPREPRALGAVFRAAVLAREIEATGSYTKTAQVLRHHAPIAVWRKART